ncbi:MAG TPA: molybdate ABC transporter substrate-binding protein [Candidatus Limnocylindrales bacterium]|nr:molybdate ABC transporter substrate-binding protein [Candidatus Limnocylindrales bacterium]
MSGRRSAGIASATVILVALAAAGCGGARGSTIGGVGERTLVVFAAASLREPVEAAGAGYEARHRGLVVRVAYASSTALRVQIEEGAPADLFLSADLANADRLEAAGLTAGSPVPFAGNRLAIVVPAGRELVRAPRDLAADGVAVIAAGEGVPITAYAGQLVGRLATLPGYPGDFAARYAANVVSREDDVAAVVAKIGLGEGDAAIVYATDVARTPGVETIPLPAGVEIVATYAGVVVRDSPGAAEGRAFLEWLAGPDGRAAFGAAGFASPP